MAKFKIYSEAFREGKRKKYIYIYNNLICLASGQNMNLEVSEYKRVLTIYV